MCVCVNNNDWFLYYEFYLWATNCLFFFCHKSYAARDQIYKRSEDSRIFIQKKKKNNNSQFESGSRRKVIIQNGLVLRTIHFLRYLTAFHSQQVSFFGTMGLVWPYLRGRWLHFLCFLLFITRQGFSCVTQGRKESSCGPRWGLKIVKLGTRADIRTRIGRVQHQNSAGMQYHSGGCGISGVVKTSSRRKRQKTLWARQRAQQRNAAVEPSCAARRGGHLNYLIFSTTY